MNPISFTAYFVDNVNIKCLDKDNVKRDKEIALVELDKDFQPDRDAVLNAAFLWQRPGKHNYAWNILNEMEKEWSPPDTLNEHYYALTTQKKGYEKLNERKILGVLMLSEYDTNCSEIEWFQVKPLYKYSKTNKDRKYSDIGYAMLKYVIDNYKHNPIFVSASTEAVEFYKKYGFKQVEKCDEYDLYYVG